jgi:hypothetical protein
VSHGARSASSASVRHSHAMNTRRLAELEPRIAPRALFQANAQHVFRLGARPVTHR